MSSASLTIWSVVYRSKETRAISRFDGSVTLNKDLRTEMKSEPIFSTKHACSSGEPLAAFLVPSPADARNLIEQNSLNLSPDSLPPELFWATIQSSKWRPLVICVKRGQLIVGIAYFKERIVAGMPSGHLHGNSTLRDMIDAGREIREQVLQAALRFIFSDLRAYAISLHVPTAEFDSATYAGLAEHVSVDMFHSPAGPSHSRLSLPGDYESFLHSLGRHTRRNLRYYRRRFEIAGNSYVENLSPDEFKIISRELRGKSRIPTKSNILERSIDLLKTAERPLLAGLHAVDGRWLSVITGWREGNRVTFFSQLNSDIDHPHDSLSMVLRGYVFESLIRSGVRTLDFLWGTKGPLVRYAKPFPTVNVHFESITPQWRILRRSLAMLNRMCIGDVGVKGLFPGKQHGYGVQEF